MKTKISKLDFDNVLLDALPNPIYYKDIEGKFIRCNECFAKLADTCKKEIIGKSAYEFFPKRVADRHKAIDKKIMKTLKPNKSEVHFIRKNGEVRYYNMNKAVCLNNTGEMLGTVCIMTDITERIKQKELLIQQSKFAEMGEMIASIAHQWHEPLVELSAQVHKVELMCTQKMDNKLEITNFVKDSMIQIQYMSETLSDFRNFLKPSVIKKEFGIKNAISEVFDIIGKQIFYCNIVINQKYINDKEIFIFGYKNEFKQVILNIINNAKNKILNMTKNKFFKGVITIQLSQDKKYTILEIMDNAGAIEEQIMDLIFDPFFTTNNNGTGYGLYLAKLIIEDKMLGKLSVKNSNDNVIFKIKIPKKDNKNENFTTRG